MNQHQQTVKILKQLREESDEAGVRIRKHLADLDQADQIMKDKLDAIILKEIQALEDAKARAK